MAPIGTPVRIIALGNPDRGDDAAALIVAERFRTEASVVAAGRPGPGLFDFFFPDQRQILLDVVVSGVVVRTQTAINARNWTYTYDNNIADNGSLADELTFRVSNYTTSAGVKYNSEEATLTVRRI